MLTLAPGQAYACTIANASKFGVGVVGNSPSQLSADLTSVRSQWYYDWQAKSSGTSPGYVPMIWSAQYRNYAAQAPGDTLLTFNEPDNKGQANMTYDNALWWWKDLMATGKRLGSPAVQTGNELGTKWLGQFMLRVKQRDLRVDFMAVHYYTTNRSVSAFKLYLQNIYNAYQRPIWVTEWALADWSNQNRFTTVDQATFLTQAVEMMDDLPFVERHAWFGIYEGLDGWNIGSGLISNGQRTNVGDAFLAEVSC